ncbi:MAG: hypothetical protein EOP09_08845, partial [Proteobacteria bacterium]
MIVQVLLDIKRRLKTKSAVRKKTSARPKKRVPVLAGRSEPKPSAESSLRVVGIGASAGGLEALSLFFRALRAPANTTFVVAQHLAPHSKSMMVELLRKQTAMVITAVEDLKELRSGEVCIIPPNFDATLVGTTLHLVEAGEATRPKPSVNTLFESMARQAGERAVGIILSGTGTDGAEGIRIIRECGGITLVQDPTTAKYDGMPKAAIDTNAVDEVHGPEALASRLSELLVRTDRAPDKKESEDVREILRVLKQESGSDFLQYKTATIGRRVRKRMNTLKISQHSEYVKQLKGNPEEVSALAQELLVSVTSFFRDPTAFAEARKQLEKVIAAKEDRSELRIWVAACATQILSSERSSLAAITFSNCFRASA